MLDKLYLYLTDSQLDVLLKSIKLAKKFSSTPVSFSRWVKDLIDFAYKDKDVLYPNWEYYGNLFDKELKNKSLNGKNFPKYYINCYVECAEWWESKLEFLKFKKKEAIKDESGRYMFEIDLTGSYLSPKLLLDTFPCLLELIVRLSLGQIETMWEVMNGILDEKTKKPVSELFCVLSRDAEPFRNRMFKIFPECGSLGIGSEKLTDDVKVLYEMYKAYLYQYNCYGVNSYGPIKFSCNGDPMPEFGFEEQFVCDYTSNNNELEENYKKGIDETYRILRKPIYDDGELFFPIDKLSGTVCQKLKPGQKLFRKVNGYYDIE